MLPLAALLSVFVGHGDCGPVGRVQRDVDGHADEHVYDSDGAVQAGDNGRDGDAAESLPERECESVDRECRGGCVERDERRTDDDVVSHECDVGSDGACWSDCDGPDHERCQWYPCRYVSLLHSVYLERLMPLAVHRCT